MLSDTQASDVLGADLGWFDIMTAVSVIVTATPAMSRMKVEAGMDVVEGRLKIGAQSPVDEA